MESYISQITSRKLTIETGVLCLSILLLPFIKYEELLDVHLLPRQFFLQILTAVLSIILLFRKNQCVVSESFLKWSLLPCFLLLIYATSISYAHLSSEAVFWTTKISTYVLFFLVVLLAKQNQRINWYYIIFTVFISLLISGFLMFLEIKKLPQSHFFQSLDNLYKLHGPFSHKNLFSSYVLLSMPFLFLLFFLKKPLISFLTGGIIVVFLVMVLFLQSKAVLLAFLIASVILLIPVLVVLKKAQSSLFRYVVSALLLLILTLGGFWLSQKKNIKETVQTASFEERIAVWENTTEMIKEHPVLGVGAGNFQILFPKYGLEKFTPINQTIADGMQTFQRPHNDFLWVMSETGILGIAIYVSIFFLLFVFHAGRIIRNKEIAEQLISVVVMFFLLSYFTMAFFDFPLERSEHQMLFILFIVFSLPVDETPKKINYRNFHKWLLSVIAIISLVTGVYVINRMKGEKEAKQVVSDHVIGDWNAILYHVGNAEEFSNEINNMSIPIVWYRGVAEFTLGDIGKAHQSFLKAYAINPYQIHVLNNLAGTFLKTGNFDKALYFYDEALEINSGHREVLLNKSIAFYQQGMKKEAFSVFVEIDYDDSWSEMYNKAFSVIFNDYLEERIAEDTVKNRIENWKNIQAHDSVKKIILYEYHHNGKSLDEMLN